MSTGQVYAPALAPTPIMQAASTTAASDHTVGTIVGVVFGVIGFILVLCLFTCCCGMCRIRKADLDLEKASDDGTFSTFDRDKGCDGHGHGQGIDHVCRGDGEHIVRARVEETDDVRETILDRRDAPMRWPPGGSRPPTPDRNGPRNPGGYGYRLGGNAGNGYRPRRNSPSPEPPRPRPPPPTLPPPFGTLPIDLPYAVQHRRSLSSSSSSSESSSGGTSPTIPSPLPPGPPPPYIPPGVRRVRIQTPPRPPSRPPSVGILHSQPRGPDCVSRATLARAINDVVGRQAEELDEVSQRIAVEREQRHRDTQRLERRNGQLTEDVAEMRESMVDLSERVGDLGDRAAGLQQDVDRLEIQQQMQRQAAQAAAARPQPPVVVNNNLFTNRPPSRGSMDPDLPDNWPGPPGPPGPRGNGPGPRGPRPRPPDVYQGTNFETVPESPSTGEYWSPSSNGDVPPLGSELPEGAHPLPGSFINYGPTFAPELTEADMNHDSDRLSHDTRSEFEQPSPRTKFRRPSIEYPGAASASLPTEPRPGIPNRPRRPRRTGLSPAEFVPSLGRPRPRDRTVPRFVASDFCIPVNGEGPSREPFPERRSREDLRDRDQRPMHPFPPPEEEIRRRRSMDQHMNVHPHPPNRHPDDRDSRRPRRGSMGMMDPGLQFDPQQHRFTSANMRRDESDIPSFDSFDPRGGRPDYDPEQVRGTSRRTSSTAAWPPEDERSLPRDDPRSRWQQDKRRLRTRMENMETIQSQDSGSEYGGLRQPHRDRDSGSSEAAVGRDGRMQYDRYD
ncbi:hypothetical protein ABW21_db0202187 [Orbilia brochopaga]|nr:hypothetical protein ABW21_db0202187 [Drechslerella brochopaga]